MMESYSEHGFSPYVPHVVSCFLLEKIAAGNVQIASPLSSPCWKEQRSLRAMSGSLGVGATSHGGKQETT